MSGFAIGVVLGQQIKDVLDESDKRNAPFVNSECQSCRILEHENKELRNKLREIEHRESIAKFLSELQQKLDELVAIK